jgi:hypothetical protein
MIAKRKSMKAIRYRCIRQMVFLATLLALAVLARPAINAAAANAAELQADASRSGLAPGAPAVYEKGPLPQEAVDQVRAIVIAQIKAALGPAEEGKLGIFKFDKRKILSVTTADGDYSARVFRPFSEISTGSPDVDLREYFVQTMGPWRLSGNAVIPSDTYLTGIADQVSAYDAGMIAAQEASLRQSAAFCKEALDELTAERKRLVLAPEEVVEGQSPAEAYGIAEAQFPAKRKALLAARESLRRQIVAGAVLSRAGIWSESSSSTAPSPPSPRKKS